MSLPRTAAPLLLGEGEGGDAVTSSSGRGAARGHEGLSCTSCIPLSLRTEKRSASEKAGPAGSGDEDEHFVGIGGAGEEVGGGAEAFIERAGAAGGGEVIEVAYEGGHVGGERFAGGRGGEVGGEDGGFGGVEGFDEHAADFFFGGVEAGGAFAFGEHGVGIVEEENRCRRATGENARVAGEEGV